MSSFAVREAKLRQAIADASSLAEQRRLTSQLDALRREAADQVAIDRELELGAQIVRDTTTPVRVHDRHTAATDWLNDIEIPNGENYDKAMRVEAALWFKKLHTAVKSDRDEFAEQAQGMASRLAGQYGPKAAEAAQAFLSEVARLFRQADDRASDQAPDHDQSGNAESEVTDYDPETDQEPMWGEDYDGEQDTGSQIGSEQPSEQPGSSTARRRYPKGSARGGGRTATRKAAGWSAGWNMPGYMPETEPEYFEDFESARDYIADELDRAADHVYDTDPNLADAYDSAIRDLKMTNQGPWSDLLPTSDSSYDLGISYWIDQSEDAQVWASRKRANEGKTCATCGDSIAQTDGDWHHDNGEKHDHKATPGSDKESRRKTANEVWNTCIHCGRTIVIAQGDPYGVPDGVWIDPNATGDDSIWRETCDENDTFTAEHEPSGATARRKTAGVYCNTHDVWVGDGNEDTHEGCSKEQKATEKTKDARRKTASVEDVEVRSLVIVMIRDYKSGGSYDQLRSRLQELQSKGVASEAVEDALWQTTSPNGSLSALWNSLEEIAKSVGVDTTIDARIYKKAADDEATNEFAEEVAEELAGTSEETESSEESESFDNDDDGDVSSEDDDESDKEAKLTAFRKKVAESMPFGAPCPDEDCGLEEGHAGEHQDA